jgi:hypothetical protein
MTSSGWWCCGAAGSHSCSCVPRSYMVQLTWMSTRRSSLLEGLPGAWPRHVWRPWSAPRFSCRCWPQGCSSLRTGFRQATMLTPAACSSTGCHISSGSRITTCSASPGPAAALLHTGRRAPPIQHAHTAYNRRHAASSTVRSSSHHLLLYTTMLQTTGTRSSVLETLQGIVQREGLLGLFRCVPGPTHHSNPAPHCTCPAAPTKRYHVSRRLRRSSFRPLAPFPS